MLTVNGSKIFGAYEYPEALIQRVIRNAVLGQVLSVSRSGDNVRDWLFVEDFCRAIDRVLEAGCSGEVYNVGGGNEMKNEDVVNTLCGILVEASEDFPFSRQSCLSEFSNNPPGANLRYAMDCTKIEEELGWAPQESFASGLAKTVGWYLEQQNWCRKVMESR